MSNKNKVHLQFNMSHEAYWDWLCRVCEREFVKHGQNVTVPLEPSPRNPLKEFKDVDVSKNVWRFVVFVLWLRHQPLADKWFALIHRGYRALVNHCVITLTKRIATL